MSQKNKLILALDVPDIQKADYLIQETAEYVGYYKIGLGFLAQNGIEFARQLVKQGHKIFLDLKLFDISQTISDAVARLADTGVHIMTVQGDPYVVQAAVKGRYLAGRTDLDIYAVTILTSLNEIDIRGAGYHGSVQDVVLERAKQASFVGADGVIASGLECRAIKANGWGLKVITPGIRTLNSQQHDQKRTMTAQQALLEGADHLVIGRDITAAESPKQAAQAILSLIEAA